MCMCASFSHIHTLSFVAYLVAAVVVAVVTGGGGYVSAELSIKWKHVSSVAEIEGSFFFIDQCQLINSVNQNRTVTVPSVISLSLCRLL
ncbi:hypothetical protein LWI29_008582 [Acer saccharum]|uniref:Uncharacterized protein n=1 Tax=Acer saccharum TaxID=4024 RepID=A0AA39VFM4_ACESA|nr:hypothetical protein LWI29_008582 [Acer saccharum]